MTSIEKNFIRDYKKKLQYITLSRGVDFGDLSPKVAEQYGMYYGGRVNALVRFDDDCKNGHCTLSVTGKTRDAAGQISDLLAEVFPELIPAMKFHLCSTDGPMYYIANTTYHAGNRDHYGKAAGEPLQFQCGVRFGDVPVTHRLKKNFYTFLQGRIAAKGFSLIEVPYVKTGGTDYKFAPKYTLDGFVAKWHECPFDDKTEAEEFCAALNTCAVEFVEVPTAWSEGKARELNYARSTAIWPDATDEELSVSKEELTAKLEARLPALMAQFRSVVESLGFDYDFPAHKK